VSDVRTLERDRQETTEPAVEPTDRLPVATVPATRKAARRTLTASAAAALDGRRLFVLLPFGMVAGAAIYAGAGAEPQAFVLPGLAIASAAALWLSRNSLAAVRVVMLAVSLAAGFAVMMAHSLLFGTPMLGEPRYGVYEATIAAVLSEGEGGGRIVLSDIVPTGTARPLGIFLARISVPDALSLNRGDRIRAAIRFAPIPAPVFPGGFDSAFHAYFSGIGAFGNSTGAIAVLAPTTIAPPQRFIEDLRRGIAQRLAAGMAQPAAGIATALVTGDQTTVSEEARDVMATAGIAHVLSVSGLHLTIVAGWTYFGLRLLLALSLTLGQRWPVKKLAALAGIAMALFYNALASGPAGNVAALRATVMIVLVLGAILFGRRALTMRNVAIAAVLIIVTDPASIFRASFQLSFAAVVALIGAYELASRPAETERTRLRSLFGFVGGIIATSLVAGAATTLFSAYHFQQLSPLGVLGNLLSFPLILIMMIGGLCSVLLMPLGLESAVLPTLAWSIDAMLSVARMVTQWSAPLEAHPVLQPWTLVAGLAAFAWFAFLKDRWRLAGPALIVPLVLMFGGDVAPDVLVADTTQAVAVRDGGALTLAAGRIGTFATDVWGERYGVVVPAGEGRVQCDSQACVDRSDRGFSLSIVRGPEAFAEDCLTVDLVIARIPAPALCSHNATVIDADDLASHGVHWLRWDAPTRTFEIRASVDDADRPWRP